MCGFQYHSFENCPSKRGSRDAIVGAVWVTTMALPEISVSIRSTKAASRKASALAWLALMPISRLSFMYERQYGSSETEYKPRSEERRVGKEGVSTCRYRSSPNPQNRKRDIRAYHIRHITP